MSDNSLRRDLIQLCAWIEHWQEDAACNLKPTDESLADAKQLVEGCIGKASAVKKEGASLEARLAELEKENERLRKALKEAADALDAAMEDVEHWGAYAGEYFQDKHDLDGDLARISEQATAARRALEGCEA